MRYTIGLDVHKKHTQACVMNDSGDVLEEKRFRTRAASFRNALKKYPQSRVVIESVGFHRPVARWLKEQGHEVHVANTRAIEKPKTKTDKKDARHLAHLLRVDLLPESYLPTEAVQRLRDLGRHRRFLGEQSGRLKSKIRHDLYKHGRFVDENPAQTKKGRESLKTLGIPEIVSTVAVLESVQDEIARVERAIETCGVELPSVRVLRTMPGVGAYLALVIAAEVGDFHRFPDGEALASYAGLVSRQDQSGEKDRRGPITKTGNDVLRWALVEAARNHVRVCPESGVSKRFERLKANKPYGVAITATAKNLCGVFHVMVTRGEAFKVNP